LLNKLDGLINKGKFVINIAMLKISIPSLKTKYLWYAELKNQIQVDESELIIIFLKLGVGLPHTERNSQKKCISLWLYRSASYYSVPSVNIQRTGNQKQTTCRSEIFLES